MAKRIEVKWNYFIVTDTITSKIERRLPASRVSYDFYNNTLHIIYINRYDQNYHILLSELIDSDGVAFTEATLLEFMDRYTGGTTITTPVDVVIQDSTSPLFILHATEILNETTLTVDAVIDGNTFALSSVTGVLIGRDLTVYSPTNNRVSFFHIISISGNVVTVDSPIDFNYAAGEFVQIGNSNLAVDGSVTPRIFGIRNPTAQDINLSVDITRMILSMQLTGGGDYDEFGNIPKLTNGLVCRFVDGHKDNIFNVKDNRGFDNLMYDLKFISASGNAPDGLSGRFTFTKLGAVIRLKPFEDLHFIVQDDLSAITEFEITAQGSGVID